MGGPPLLGDFLVTAVCPIEKVTLWEGLLRSMLGSKYDEGIATAAVFTQTINRTRGSLKLYAIIWVVDLRQVLLNDQFSAMKKHATSTVCSGWVRGTL